jgi:glycosyltransferase involved in cell wall biosynthesis
MPSPAGQAHKPYIIFTGVMDYPPNVDAACWFSNEVWPMLHGRHPDLEFKIVGKNPAPKVLDLGRRNGIEVTGTVPDIRPYVAGARALVVPLRSGGGTRLKILEGMALERPVIATSVGAEGLDITPGLNILIADDAAAFIDQIELLLRLERAAADLGKAGRRLVVEKYEWRACLAGLESLYEAVTGKAAA